VIVAIVVSGRPADALAGDTYCPHGGNVTASGCVNSRFGETYTGAYGTWNNNTMWLDSPGAQSGPHYDIGYHINWEMWLYTQPTSDVTLLVEFGLRDGKANWIPCGCRDYVIFWAEFDSQGMEHPHWLASTGPTGQTHHYQISLDTTTFNKWVLLLDGNNQGSTQFQTSSLAYEIQTGLEVTRPPVGQLVGTWAHADTFDSQLMQSRDTAGNWTTWSYNTDWIDQPCAPHNGLPASPAGSCFNGAASVPYDWQANKP
jgi:hypothetical protein